MPTDPPAPRDATPSSGAASSPADDARAAGLRNLAGWLGDPTVKRPVAADDGTRLGEEVTSPATVPTGDSGTGPGTPASDLPDLDIPHVRLQRRLGAGGMGEVLLGFHEGFKLPVAVKLLPAQQADPELAERFLREAQVAVRVDHPNIVRIYDVGRERAAGRLYIVMEYVEGQDLEAYARDHGGTLPVVESLRLIRSAAQGIAYAHSQGVLHRDIKPANLIRRARDLRVKILDFGLARAAELEPLTREGGSMGTLSYAAGEQLCAVAEPASDVYGLGASLYRLLAGRPPVGGSVTEVLAYHAQKRLPPPIGPAGTLPPRLEALLARLLSPSPKGRPTAAEAVAEIDAILRASGERSTDQGEEAADAVGEPGARPARSTSWAAAEAKLVPSRLRRRLPWRAATGAAAFATALLGLAWWYGWAGRDAQLRGVATAGPEVARPGVPPAARDLNVAAAVLIAPAEKRGAAGGRVVATLPASARSRFPTRDVRDGDAVRFALRSEEPHHVYVFNIDGKGAVCCLFPDEYERLQAENVAAGKALGAPVRNPLPPEKGVILVSPLLQQPDSRRGLLSFELDQTIGREWFMIAAAPAPIAELEQVRKRLRAGPVDGEEVRRLARSWEGQVAAGQAGDPHELEVQTGAGEEPLGEGWCSVRARGPAVWTVELEHK